jgi:hypothetical protein
MGYSGSSSGFTGSFGYSGSLGYVGSTGFRGSVGFAGSVGYTGSRGAGFGGSQGDIGYSGSQGDAGYTGSSSGFTGSQGDIGYTGSYGDLGFTGSEGSGFVGSRGFTGSRGGGFTGSAGFIGSFGFVGSQGDIGPIGYTGSGNAGGGGSPLELSEIDATETKFTNTVTNVTAIRFDSDSGFAVSYLGSGAVKIAMNSTFKFWNVNGVPGLTAEGLDTVDFITGPGMSIVTNTSGTHKSITFSAQVSGYTGSSAAGFIGSVGYTGSYGAQGLRGYAGSQSYTGSQGEIGYTGSFGYTGSLGRAGYTGSTGLGLKIVNSVNTYTSLPSPYNGAIGDAYFVQIGGHVWIWIGSGWTDIGQLIGGGSGGGSSGTGTTYVSGGSPNLDGGYPFTKYGGIAPIDGGSVII